MTLFTIYDNNGLFWGEFHNEQPINSTFKIYQGNFVKPLYNKNEDDFYESATTEEIAEYQKSLVPQIITRRQFKIALAVLGKNEDDILNGINQLPEPNKTIARISYMEAGTFERFNPELIFVATNFLQMNEADIDEIFIIGNQY